MYMLCYVVMRFIFNCSTTQYVVAVFWDHSICHLQYIEKLNSFASFIYPIYRSIVCLVVIRSSIFTRTHVVSFVNKIPRIFDSDIFFEDRLHKFCLKFVISNLTFNLSYTTTTEASPCPSYFLKSYAIAAWM